MTLPLPGGRPGPDARPCSLPVLLLAFWPALGASAQVTPPPEPGTPFARVAPGAEYSAGTLHRTLMGRGFRVLWTTPITVPVADLDTLGGGLTPVRIGGGVSTRTLHLDGGDGRRYVFRGVNKTPTELLDDFRGSAVEGVIQDQIAAFHPTAAPVVADLLEAVGVLHAEPAYVVVPDDPRLGPFREEFAGRLVLFEERPADGREGRVNFAGSDRVAQTPAFFTALKGEPRDRLAVEELLRSRLIDLLVGDRDRSHNNYLWARFPDDSGGALWRVIPRDRDQAFVRFDGALMSVARRYDRRFVSFTDTYPDLAGLTRNAWDIDRNLLVALDRKRWELVTAEVVRALDDETLRAAVARMPPEHTALVGAELESALRRRRDHLGAASEALYDIVFRFADVRTTDRREEATITRHADGSVDVRVVAPRAGALPTFHRVFVPGETEEVRLYLRGGDDVVEITGDGPPRIRVRVIGGGGRDRFVLRDPRSGRGVELYDAGTNSSFPARGPAVVHRRAAPPPSSWWFEERTLDWGSHSWPSWRGSFDVDRGLVVLPGIRHERYGFSRRPYATRTTLRAGWATGPAEPVFDARHLSRGIIAGADLDLHFQWSGAELTNYFGFGNQTVILGQRAFHRIVHRRMTATAGVAIGDGVRRSFQLGPTLLYTSTDTTGGSSLMALERPYGSGAFSHAGVRTSFMVDRRDARGAPRSGFVISGSAGVFPGILDAARGTFGRVEGQIATYVAPEAGNPVLALRATGARVWGAYPLTEAAFLGGPNTLRGVREQRYAGDAMVAASAELRLELARLTFPFGMNVGVLTLVDVGRVWWSGEASDRWHLSYGGGVWAALPGRSNSARFAVARSGRQLRPSAGVGFAF